MVEWEEVEIDGTLWIKLRARGAEWSWFTAEEALKIAREWLGTIGLKE